jgi:hypothetical protein
VTALRFRRALSIILALPLALGGCYAYGPPEGPAPEPGQRVRAQLTSSGAAWLLENWGRSRSSVDGLFVRGETDEVVLAAWRADLPGMTGFDASIDTVRVPRRHVAQLQERRLSPVRTAVAAAVGVGIVSLAVSELAGIGGSSGDDDGGTQFLVIPLHRLLGR